jgi:hypothetical protein
MAANAAALAAATAAAQVATERHIKMTGDKQYDTMLKTIEPLEVVGYPKLRDQLHREGYRNEWPPHILDIQLPRPLELSDKERMDERNAYLIIMAKTDGHMVASILENITQGDAKGVYKALHELFYNDSQAGKGAAMKSFHLATMGSTDLNVVEYTAQISRLAKIVRESGGQADEGAQLSVLLDGLLPEFDFIKKTLNAVDGLTLDVARSKILHFAKQEGLELTIKGGAKPGKHNVFTLDGDRL